MTLALTIPTLGQRPSYLALCAASVLDTDLDIAVCMVAPPDKVGELSREFPRIPVFAQRGHGIAAAITEGWAHLGPTEYCAWLGDDDLLTRGSLRAAVTALDAAPRAMMVFGRAVCVDHLGRPLYKVRPGRHSPFVLRLGRNLIMQPGCVYRTCAVESIGGLDTNLRLAFDVDLHRRLIDLGPAIYLPRTLAVFREHPTSLTVANGERSQAEADFVLCRQMRTDSLLGRRARLTAARKIAGLSARLTWRPAS
ncbi:MAG TPA: glycosyltransferase [Sporichthyaceae bacterium]|jgi:hypothetical protein|nr:glycosyltransferase [Sporichthyaceae bacterium]